MSSVPRNNSPVNAQELYHCLRFPLSNDNDTVVPRESGDTREALIGHLTVDEDIIHSIESATREQAGWDEWETKHIYRFTPSNSSLSQGDKEITKVVLHHSCILSPFHHSM